MKILLIVTLVLNFLFEGPVGVFLVLSPEASLPGGSAEELFWVRNYGVAAMAIASMALWAWPARTDFRAMGVALGYLMGFHIALAIALFTSGIQPGGAIIHSVLAVLFVVLYFQRARWCDPQNS